MKLLFQNSTFSLSLYPLFTNAEGKYTAQFIHKKPDEKPIHESFLLDFHDLLWFLESFFAAQRILPLIDSEFCELMKSKAPLAWSKLEAGRKAA